MILVLSNYSVWESIPGARSRITRLSYRHCVRGKRPRKRLQPQPPQPPQPNPELLIIIGSKDG